MGREMAGHHHVILVKDGNQRRSCESDALIPVTRQAKTLGIDRDPRRSPATARTRFERLVIGTVVRDDQFELRTLLRQNAS